MLKEINKPEDEDDVEARDGEDEDREVSDVAVLDELEDELDNNEFEFCSSHVETSTLGVLLSIRQVFFLFVFSYLGVLTITLQDN